jgi:hypothetical protein
MTSFIFQQTNHIIGNAKKKQPGKATGLDVWCWRMSVEVIDFLEVRKRKFLGNLLPLLELSFIRILRFS